MKNNRLLCALTAIAILFTSSCIVWAEKNTNAYETMYFLDADEHSSGLSKNVKYNCLGIAKKNHYVLYKDVDFGDDTAGFIDVSYAVADKYAGGTLNVYADDMTEDNLYATVTSVSTGSWTDFSSSHTALLNGLTGKHDIYFMVTSEFFGNLRSFNFTNSSAETENAAAEFIEKINSDKAENYPNIFSEYSGILGLDVSEFKGGEEFVYGYINKNIPYTDFSAFKTCLADAVLLMNVNNADSGERLKSILENNQELISSANAEFVQSYKTMNQEEVCGTIVGLIENETVNSKAEFANIFNRVICGVLYAECDSIETLANFLERYKIYLSLDKYSDFKTMSERSKNNILGAVLGAKLEDLNDSFSNAYAAEVKRLEDGLRSAYAEFNFYESDYITDGLTRNTQFSCISNTFSGRYIRYDELNFGTSGARAMDFTYGATEQYTGEVKIYIDSISDSNEIASLFTSSTGDWHTWSTVTVPILKTVTGVHDVYIRFGGVVGDVKSMQFYTSKIVSASNTQIMLYKNGTETDNINEADKISVNGSIEVINNGTTKANIVANIYDENMTPLTDYMISSQILQSGVQNNISLEKNIDSGISPVSANAFIIDDSFIIYGEPAFSGMYAAEKAASEKPIEVKVSDTKISVLGKTDSTHCAIGVRKKTVGREDFESYSFIAPIKSVENLYLITFEAPSKMDSGDYTAVVFDGKGGYSEENFSFISAADIESALAAINAAKESEGVSLWQAVKSIAEKNEKFLGIDTSAANLMPEWVYTNLAKGIPYEKVSELQKNFGFYTILSTVAGSSDAEKIIDKNSEILGISSDKCAEKYRKNKSIKGGAAKRIAAMLEKNMTDTTEEFLEAYKLSACFETLSKAVSWGEIDEALTDFNKELALSDYDSYSKMTSDKKSQICRSLLNIGEQNLTADGIRKAFEQAYKSAAAVVDTGGRGNSGGGGGGNGGSTLYVPKPEQEDEENSVKFKDIDDCPWARNQIVNFYQSGFINGKSEESFCPYDNVTRAEFIKILCLSLNMTVAGDCSFTDLSKDDWSYPYIAAAYKAGIVSGYDDGTVRGGNYITREEMAAMAYRAALIRGIQTEQIVSGVSFVDGEQISSWAYEAVISLAKSNILHGMGADLFCPQKLAGRAEAVVFLSNLRAAG